MMLFKIAPPLIPKNLFDLLHKFLEMQLKNQLKPLWLSGWAFKGLQEVYCSPVEHFDSLGKGRSETIAEPEKRIPLCE